MRSCLLVETLCGYANRCRSKIPSYTKEWCKFVLISSKLVMKGKGNLRVGHHLWLRKWLKRQIQVFLKKRYDNARKENTTAMQEFSSTSPFKSNDNTWVLPIPTTAFNGFSVVLPIERSNSAAFDVGNLVRLIEDATEKSDVLWRSVAHTSGVFGSMAIFVPTQFPATVPASSVRRVEFAAKGRDIERNLAA